LPRREAHEEQHMSEAKTEALVVTHGTTALDSKRDFEPRDLSGLLVLAKILAASNVIPKAYVGKHENVVSAIVCGRELGMTAMQSLRGIHVIEGRPTLGSDTMAGIVKSDARCEYFALVESTDERAVYRTKRRSDPEPVTMSFTIEEANLAGLTGKDTWKKYPKAMLRARAIAALARAVYPDVLGGLYDPDEVPESEPPRNVTPPAEAKPRKQAASVVVVPPAVSVESTTPAVAVPLEVVPPSEATTQPPDAPAPSPEDDGRDPVPEPSAKYTEFVQQFADAKTLGEVSLVSTRVRPAHEGGDISADERQALLACYAEAKKRVAK
jgi:hypothetical protein